MLLLGYFLVFAGVCHAQNDKGSEKVKSPCDKKKSNLFRWLPELGQQYGDVSDEDHQDDLVISPKATNLPPVPIDQSKCKPCSCGLVNNHMRIVGGDETLVNQYPWMALIIHTNVSKCCGGTLINSRYILTAAHCVSGFSKKAMRVRLLEHNLNLDNETKIIKRRVKQIYKHPDFIRKKFDNDIALLRLNKEVEFTEDFMPACLPPPGKTFAGEIGIVTGWGSIKQSGPSSPTLQKIEIPILTNDECKKKGYEKKQITDNMMCAGFKEGGKSACGGDSGGPLHVKEKDNHFVAANISSSAGTSKLLQKDFWTYSWRLKVVACNTQR